MLFRSEPYLDEGVVTTDFNGDGHTDLFVTTSSYDRLLWNNGNGTFTEGARAAGIRKYGWHGGAAGADVNARSPEGWMALHVAAKGGSGDIIRLLMAKGANVHLKDGHGNMPLHLAVYHEHREAIRIFFAYSVSSSCRRALSRSTIAISSALWWCATQCTQAARSPAGCSLPGKAPSSASSRSCRSSTSAP